MSEFKAPLKAQIKISKHDPGVRELRLSKEIINARTSNRFKLFLRLP